MPAGSMLAVPLSETDCQPYLNAAVSLATVNAPSMCVLSGPPDAIETISRPTSRRADSSVPPAAHLARVPLEHDGAGDGAVRRGHGWRPL